MVVSERRLIFACVTTLRSTMSGAGSGSQLATASGGISKDVMDAWFKAAGKAGAPDFKTLQGLLDKHKGELDVNATGKDGWTALAHAAFHGRVDVISWLLRSGAKVDFAKGHYAPMGRAVVGGHVDAVRALIAGGAKVNEQASDDLSTALHEAARSNRSVVVRVLLEAGADPSIRNKYGWTAADAAGNDDILDVLEFAGKPKPSEGSL